MSNNTNYSKQSYLFNSFRLTYVHLCIFKNFSDFFLLKIYVLKKTKLENMFGKFALKF